MRLTGSSKYWLNPFFQRGQRILGVAPETCENGEDSLLSQCEIEAIGIQA
jgi:hypothetical protein